MSIRLPPDELIPPRAYPALSQLWVAYSGGLDSTVLLHALAYGGVQRPRVLHAHHGLQPAADAWAEHCARQCAEWGLELQVCRLQVEDHGQGLEAAAREARYQAFAHYLQAGDVLAAGHHQDDQAETVLLRLLRGAGPAGLAAMRPLRALGAGKLWRPLLELPRASLRRYAREHGLRWIEDPHNDSPRFARSYLRQEILPRLQKHWPGAMGNLSRTAALSAETADLLSDLARSDLATMPGTGESLPIAALLALPFSRRGNLLRYWVESRGLPLPYRDTLERLEAEVLTARADADPVLAWPGGEFRRYRDRLYLMPGLFPVPDAFEVEWQGASPLALPPDCGSLRAVAMLRRPLRVRLAAAGERFRPAGSAHSRTLKNLFQEQGVPPWVRERTPVLCDDDGLVWVAGIGGTQVFADIDGNPDVEWYERPIGASER